MTTTTITATRFLVYGTLRPGCGNYQRLLAGKTVSETDVVLNGFIMFSTGGFPFLVPVEDQSKQVVATLVTIAEEHAEDALYDLDWLEGYRGDSDPSNLYNRHNVTLNTDEGEVNAWLYLDAGYLTDGAVDGRYSVIESGDWLNQ